MPSLSKSPLAETVATSKRLAENDPDTRKPAVEVVIEPLPVKVIASSSSRCALVTATSARNDAGRVSRSRSRLAPAVKMPVTPNEPSDPPKPTVAASTRPLLFAFGWL